MPQEQLPGIWLIEAFRRGGVDTRELSRRLPALVTRALHRPDTLHPEDVDRILAECEALSGDAHFGLHMIDYVDLPMLGTFGYLLTHAPTVGQFLDLAVRYYPIFYPGAEVLLHRGNPALRFEYRPSHASAVASRHDNEWTIGFFVNFIRERLSSEWYPDLVTFTNAAPRNLKELRRVVGRNLRFGQPTTGFEIGRDLLNRRISESDPSMLQILTDQAESLMQRTSEADSIQGIVRLQILESLRILPQKLAHL